MTAARPGAGGVVGLIVACESGVPPPVHEDGQENCLGETRPEIKTVRQNQDSDGCSEFAWAQWV
jgi:hypothetical protein